MPEQALLGRSAHGCCTNAVTTQVVAEANPRTTRRRKPSTRQQRTAEQFRPSSLPVPCLRWRRRSQAAKGSVSGRKRAYSRQARRPGSVSRPAHVACRADGVVCGAPVVPQWFTGTP